jgi:hypothetical protein
MLSQELYVAERTMHARVEERLRQSGSCPDEGSEPSDAAFEKIVLVPEAEESDTAMLARVQRLALRSLVVLAVWRPEREVL